MALSPEAREARRRNVIDAAHALIRETGGTGFSMVQLAQQAGVSPATPYNLLGAKAEVLRRVVEDEFASFAARLAAEPPREPLPRLLRAVDLVAVHYLAEPGFYRGLYGAMLGIEGNPLRETMSEQGQRLWAGLVRAAQDAGALALLLDADALTDVLLRMMAATVETWLAEQWDEARFSRELARASRLLLLGLVSAEDAAVLRQTISLPLSAGPRTAMDAEPSSA